MRLVFTGKDGVDDRAAPHAASGVITSAALVMTQDIRWQQDHIRGDQMNVIRNIVFAASAVALTVVLGGAVPAGASPATAPNSPVIYTGRAYQAEPARINFDIKYNGLNWDGYVAVQEPKDGGWAVWNPERGYAHGPIESINYNASKSNTGNVTIGDPKKVAGVTYFTEMQLTVVLPSTGFFPSVTLTVSMDCGYGAHPAVCISDGAAKGQANE